MSAARAEKRPGRRARPGRLRSAAWRLPSSPRAARANARAPKESGLSPRAEKSEKGAESMNKLRLPRLVALFAVAALLGTIGFLAAGSVARSATGSNATVSLRKTKLGMILVNSQGRTLYLFAKDRAGASACT